MVRKEDSYYTEQVGYLVNPVRFSLVLYIGCASSGNE